MTFYFDWESIAAEWFIDETCFSAIKKYAVGWIGRNENKNLYFDQLGFVLFSRLVENNSKKFLSFAWNI